MTAALRAKLSGIVSKKSIVLAIELTVKYLVQMKTLSTPQLLSSHYMSYALRCSEVGRELLLLFLVLIQLGKLGSLEGIQLFPKRGVRSVETSSFSHHAQFSN